MDDFEEIKIHSNIDSYLDDVKELQIEWINDLLMDLGIDVSEHSNLELAKVLRASDISITSYPSFGGVLVKYREEIIAEWGGPELTLKKDKDGLYYEVIVKYKNYIPGEEDV